MKKNIKSIATIMTVLTAIFVIIILFAGCKEVNRPGETVYLIGVLQTNNVDRRNVALKDEINQASVMYAPKIKIIFEDAKNSEVKQNESILSMIEMKVDVLAVDPVNIQSVRPYLQRAIDAGIKIILLGEDIPDLDYALRIYTDDQKVGAIACQYIADLLDGQGLIFTIQYSPFLYTTKQIKIGFQQELAKYPELIVEYTVVGYGSRYISKNNILTSGILDKKPPANIIFAFNDEMALGAYDIAHSKGIQMMILGIDGLYGEDNGLQAIKDKKLTATIQKKTGGKEVVENATKILESKTTIFNRSVELPFQLITENNVDLFMK